jgi:hypothetical protein
MTSTIHFPFSVTGFSGTIVAGLILILLGCSSLASAQGQVSADADHAIDLQTAILYLTSFQHSSNADTVRGEAFGRDALLKLLNQPGCVGMRIYFGTKDDGQRVLVLVGVDVEGKDMYLGELDEKGFPCPPICDDSSPLLGK